jgi:hypothetical protein
MDLKGYQQFPEEGRPFQVVDEAENSKDQGEGSDIGPNSGDVLVFFLAEKISQRRNGKGSGADSGHKKVKRYTPVPESKNGPFHEKLLK